VDTTEDHLVIEIKNYLVSFFATLEYKDDPTGPPPEDACMVKKSRPFEHPEFKLTRSWPAPHQTNDHGWSLSVSIAGCLKKISGSHVALRMLTGSMINQ